MERRTGSPQPVVFLIDGQPADQDVYAETMRRAARMFAAPGTQTVFEMTENALRRMGL